MTPAEKVSADLRAIVELSAGLEDQAEHRANDRLMPGGKAMVALAGVANLEAHEHILGAKERAWMAEGAPGDSPYCDDDDSWEPPLQTLLFWSEQWRVEHGADYADLRPTLETEANWLRSALVWAWDNEPHFENFAEDVKKARRRAEDIVYAGRRLERTDVPCAEECAEDPPPLVVVHKWGEKEQPRVPTIDRSDEDGWRCPKCWTFYDPARFWNLKKAIAERGDGWVTVADAAELIHRRRQVIDRWINDGSVEWRIRAGRREVKWATVRDIHRETPTRRRAG